MLMREFARVVARWRDAFARERTMARVVAVLIGLLCTIGRRTVSNAILFRGGGGPGWAADYFAFSRAPWSVDKLFDSVFEVALEAHDKVASDEPVVALLDDTSLKKTSRVIRQARWMRDPLSPAFHVNLKYGLRYLHVALRLPLHKQDFAPRAISVAFELAPSAKKPGRRATDAERAEFEALRKKMSLPQRAVGQIAAQRARLDVLGHSDRKLLMAVDGSYTNRVVMCSLPERTDLIGRVRKDIALCRPADPGRHRKVYGERLPTPEAMRQDSSIAYQSVDLFYGGKQRSVRYKEISNVLWQGGARQRHLRVFILAPTPYYAPASSKKKYYYRDPAYLICTDLTSPASFLIQAYLDRWQIEPLHRDLKTGLGLGQAQVFSYDSVERLHSAVVAAWSMLTLAALRAFGPARTDDFPPLPAWRKVKSNHRASQNDLIALLRQDIYAMAAAHAEQQAPSQLVEPTPLLLLPPAELGP